MLGSKIWREQTRSKEYEQLNPRLLAKNKNERRQV